MVYEHDVALMTGLDDEAFVQAYGRMTEQLEQPPQKFDPQRPWDFWLADRADNWDDYVEWAENHGYQWDCYGARLEYWRKLEAEFPDIWDTLPAFEELDADPEYVEWAEAD